MVTAVFLCLWLKNESAFQSCSRAWRLRSGFPTAAVVALVSLFALFHGYAHGSEGTALSSFLPDATGFVLATASLHFDGLGLGLWIDKFREPASVVLMRTAGVTGALAGFAILVGVV